MSKKQSIGLEQMGKPAPATEFEDRRNEIADMVAELEGLTVEDYFPNLNNDIDHRTQGGNMKDFTLDQLEQTCGHLPKGFILHLCMENGAALVYLTDNRNGCKIHNIDGANRTLYEQINEAICSANGFR